jgi:nucleoside-triphosphatase
MMTNNATPLLFLVTGYRGAGKTTFCDRLARAARQAGWTVAGLISHPVYEQEFRAAIQAEDLRSGEKRMLATRSETPTPGAKHWRFDEAALTWGNQVLGESLPCDLLVVDELGPLEFERGAGWQAGLTAIDAREYAIAIVVVRAELLGEALLRWDEARVIEIDTPEDSARKAETLIRQLF